MVQRPDRSVPTCRALSGRDPNNPRRLRERSRRSAMRFVRPRLDWRRAVHDRWYLATLVMAFVSACLVGGDTSRGGAMAEQQPPPAASDTSRMGYLEDESACGFWTERILPVLWHLLAGRPDESRVAGLAAVEQVWLATKDQRRLGGYRLRAYADPNRPPRGYVLIGLGNAMLADQVVGAFSFLQADGFDVYAYDHRGYGLSEGKSRFAAIRSDYLQIIEHLNGKGYLNRFLYGMSIGGVFMLNAVGAGAIYDAALIDSPPSRISNYGCPARFDPVANLPDEAPRLGFVFGHRDTVVPPSDWRELAETARERSAAVFERAELAHPLMDRDAAARRSRREIMRTFLLSHAR